MVDTKRLEIEIRKSGLKKQAIAKTLSLTPYGLSLKINNVNEFKVSEMQKLAAILNFDIHKRESIFFKD